MHIPFLIAIFKRLPICCNCLFASIPYPPTNPSNDICVPNSIETISEKNQLTHLLCATFRTFPFHKSCAVTSYSIFVFFDGIPIGSLLSPSSFVLSVVLVFFYCVSFLVLLGNLMPNCFFLSSLSHTHILL